MSPQSEQNLWVRLGRSMIILLALGAARVSAPMNVVTHHNNNARTGLNDQELILTPSNVNPTQFGKKFQRIVDGYVYAQPLYVSNVTTSRPSTTACMPGMPTMRSGRTRRP